MERGARIGEARGQGGGKLIAALPQEVQGADSQAAVGDSAAGARPAATRPKAAINAASTAVRISDASPMSGPLPKTTPEHCDGARGFQQLSPFLQLGLAESRKQRPFPNDAVSPEPARETPGKRHRRLGHWRDARHQFQWGDWRNGFRGSPCRTRDPNCIRGSHQRRQRSLQTTLEGGTLTRKPPTKLRALQASLTEAVTQARLAYSFSPGSYTQSALNACLLADKNFRAFVATLSPQTAGLDAAQRLEREDALEARGPTSTEQSDVPYPLETESGTEGAAATGDSRKSIPGSGEPIPSRCR